MPEDPTFDELPIMTGEIARHVEFPRQPGARGKADGYVVDDVREFLGSEVSPAIDALRWGIEQRDRSIRGWQATTGRLTVELRAAEQRVRDVEGESEEQLRIARAHQAAAIRRVNEQYIADATARGQAIIADAEAKAAKILAGAPPEDRRLPAFPKLIDDQVTDDLAEARWYQDVGDWARKNAGAVKTRLSDTVARIQAAVAELEGGRVDLKE